jgi:hypothetical protein
MADAVLLSQSTYLHLKKWLDDYGKGLQDTLQLGPGLTVLERGTDYLKIGFEAPNSNINSTGSLVVSDGSNTVSNVTRMNFIGTLFSVTSSVAGTANIGLRTENCAN